MPTAGIPRFNQFTFNGHDLARSHITHCRLHLTDYKIPKSVKLKDELPKTNVGKVLRKDLKAEVKAEFLAKT